ncbi:putative phage abortive infection protein [Priestia sp. AB]|uniref:putative phage abortive infection protein n=1 Tax=Priestia sp. AB TaxID=3020890 RepID=UPI00232E3EF3|nr:putative phage abortive infection protein [Priestia sp. AB]MDC0706379.1 putative phage abortive infection protein [Priestia sp. AB]
MEQNENFLKKLWRYLNFIWALPLLGIILVSVFNLDFSSLGTFGDFVAGTTVPLLTFVSFLAVVGTLRMQKDQLEMQRQELQNSIEEMQATREEIKEQGKTMAIQRFESTFFNMVNLHNEIVKTIIDKSSSSGNIIGRAVFPIIFNLFKNKYNDLLRNGSLNGAHEIERVRQAYNEFFVNREFQLGHYFRNLYRIIKFIDEATLSDEEKRNYIGIIKAQLSSYELAILLYNGLSENGENFLPLMRKHNLLDNLNPKLLILFDTHYNLYKNKVNEEVLL